MHKASTSWKGKVNTKPCDEFPLVYTSHCKHSTSTWPGLCSSLWWDDSHRWHQRGKKWDVWKNDANWKLFKCLCSQVCTNKYSSHKGSSNEQTKISGVVYPGSYRSTKTNRLTSANINKDMYLTQKYEVLSILVLSVYSVQSPNSAEGSRWPQSCPQDMDTYSVNISELTKELLQWLWRLKFVLMYMQKNWC